jgi:hypothetical protein
MVGTMRRMIVLLLATAGTLLAWPGPAGAAESSCLVTVAGVNTSRAATPQTPIEVTTEAPMVMRGRSQADVAGVEIQLELAGVRWTLSTPLIKGRTWVGTVQIQSYSRVGTGLYKVVAKSVGPGGCTRHAFIRLTGQSPLSTIAGLVGAGAALVGGVLLLLSALLAMRRREELTRTLWLEGTTRYRPRVSPAGILGGLFLAGGVVILVQQYAVAYPTLLIAVASAALGILAGMAVPSAFGMIAYRRAKAAVIEPEGADEAGPR